VSQKLIKYLQKMTRQFLIFCLCEIFVEDSIDITCFIILLGNG